MKIEKHFQNSDLFTCFSVPFHHLFATFSLGKINKKAVKTETCPKPFYFCEKHI